MTSIPTFIKHSNVTTLSACLKETAKLRKISLLVGQRATGKSRLLTELLHNSPDFPQPAIMVTLEEPERNSSGKHATPVACQAFSDMYYELLKLCPPARSRRAQAHRAAHARKIYSDADFPRIFREVCNRTDDRQIRVIIIDNAQFVDTTTIQRLLSMLKRLNGQFAIILVAEMLHDEKPPDVLKDVLKPAKRYGFDDLKLYTLELERLTIQQFKDPVMPDLLMRSNLFADYADEIITKSEAIATDFWREVNGSWLRIDSLAKFLDSELDTQGLRNEQGARIITQQVVDRVLAKLRGQIPADETAT